MRGRRIMNAEPGPELTISHWSRFVGAVEDLTSLADELPGEKIIIDDEGIRFGRPTLSERDIHVLDALSECIDDLWRLMREIDAANINPGRSPKPERKTRAVKPSNRL